MNGHLVFDQGWALLGLPVLILIFLSNYYSKRGKTILKILPKNLKAQLFASRLFFSVFLACLIIAAAGPRWGIRQTPGDFRRNLDAVIAIDVSRSMDIGDGYAGGITRLERGAAIVRKAVENLPGLRYAVAVSRNRGILAIPLSWDNSVVLSFLDAADGSSLTGRGTNLESLLDAASGAFAQSAHSARAIILVSDGEELSGSLSAAVGRCARNGIAVIPVAVGSDEGRPLPADNTITSRRDSGALLAAAQETGGLYIDGSREDAADALILHLRSLASESRSGEGRRERAPRWFIFALAAILAYGISKVCLLRIKIRN